MEIPPHKIKAGLVAIIALGIGIGIPLFVWIQNQNVGGSNLKGAADILQIENPTPQQFVLAPQLTCQAQPPTVIAGSEVTWTANDLADATRAKFLWSGAVTGAGQSIASTYNAPGNFTATATSLDVTTENFETTCTVTVLPAPEPTPAETTETEAVEPALPEEPDPVPEAVPTPEPTVTRGEAVVLIAKAADIKPHKNCHPDTKHCGAGHPIFFTDITDAEQGSYIRKLTDLKYINGVSPTTFEPDTAITRHDAIALILKVFKLKSAPDPTLADSDFPITLSELVQIILKAQARAKYL